MQDRLKFRFWHKPTEKMIDCYGYNKDFVFGDVLDGIGTTYNPAKFDDCILIQSTGLKDKNGKLIYEGDIVRFFYELIPLEQSIQPIYFSEKKAGFCFKLKMRTFTEEFSLDNLTNKLEVIGNIYENPELLKECEDE